MTDIQHIDVDDEQYEDAPRDLRAYVKKLQKANETLRTERDGFRNQISESALGDVLAGFKNPGRVKTDLLSDNVDPLDSEAVSKWLEANGDDYARGEQAPATPEGEDPEPQAQVPDYDRLNGLSQVGTPSGSDKAQIVANPPQGLTGEALRQWFVAQGI